MLEFSNIFPTKWWAKYYANGAYYQVYKDNFLKRVYACFGYSIHDIINDSEKRNIVKSLWLDNKRFEEKMAKEAQERYKEWLNWCRKMGCPIGISTVIIASLISFGFGFGFILGILI